MLEAAAIVLFPFLVIYAASADVLTMTIPNRISLLMVAGFILLVPFSNLDLWEFAQHVGIGLLILSLGIVCFALGLMGGGDVKLAAAASLWLGPALILDFIILMGFFGGLLTLLVLLARPYLADPLFIKHGILQWAYGHQIEVPYGVAIALAALLSYSGSPLFRLAV